MAFRLVVGLGNPTPQYELTRHNAGFWFLDELARRNNLTFGSDARSQGMVARLDWKGESVYLLKPMQYMNRSGGSVLALANFYKIEPAQIVVAHDELDFPPGMVKLKVGGGHGGHNGLRDISLKLGNSGFTRIRIGVGHPGNRDEVVGFVLGRPSNQEADLIRRAINRASDCFPQLLESALDSVMNSLHASTME